MKFIVEVTDAEQAVDLLLELQGRPGVDVTKAEDRARKYSGRKTVKAASSRTRWTDEDTGRFIDMYTDGYTAKQIAKELGRSRNAIEHRMFKWDAGSLIDPRTGEPKVT